MSKTDLASEVLLKIHQNSTKSVNGTNSNETDISSQAADSSSENSTSLTSNNRIPFKAGAANSQRVAPTDPTEPHHGPEHAPVFDYSSQQKAWLMWAVGVGSLLGTFPFSWLSTHYGVRYVLFFAGIISATSTAVIPLAAIRHFNVFLFLRFLQVDDQIVLQK